MPELIDVLIEELAEEVRREEALTIGCMPEITYCTFKLKQATRRINRLQDKAGRNYFPKQGRSDKDIDLLRLVQQKYDQDKERNEPIVADFERPVCERDGFKPRQSKFLKTILNNFRMKNEGKEQDSSNCQLGLQVKKMTIIERRKGDQQDHQGDGCHVVRSHHKSQFRSTSFCDTRMRWEQSHSTKSNKKESRGKARRDRNLPNATMAEGTFKVYEHKIKSYREFLLQLSFAHSLKTDLRLLNQLVEDRPLVKLKAFVGRGNNCNLVKSLIKRRFWWVLVDDPAQANFVWTQLKINQLFGRQKRHAITLNERESKEDKSTRVTDESALTQSDYSKKRRPQSKEKAQFDRQRSIRAKEKKTAETAQGGYKIFTQCDVQLFGSGCPQVKDIWERTKRLSRLKILYEGAQSRVMHNHFPKNYYLGNKKALFYTLKQYYELLRKNPFSVLPLTFHIQKGVGDKEYKKFLHYYRRRAQSIVKSQSSDGPRGRNIWIVKPGENSNRGNGITVIDEIYQLARILNSKEKHPNGSAKTYIVQMYLDRPLLYHRRKFDIRHYILVTRIAGQLRGYWCFDGYVRTACHQFTCQDLDNRLTHLTNDAVQKESELYGRFEPANKLSYQEFQRYLDTKFPKKDINFFKSIYPRMRQIATDALRANFLRLDPDRLQNNFQVFGLDFMIDRQFKVWLIQINTNPCLELPCPILERIIPTMLEHSLRLSLDLVFPPPCHYPNSQKHLAPDNVLETLRMELIFDEVRDATPLQELLSGRRDEEMGQISEEEEEYDDDGIQLSDEMMV